MSSNSTGFRYKKKILTIGLDSFISRIIIKQTLKINSSECNELLKDLEEEGYIAKFQNSSYWVNSIKGDVFAHLIENEKYNMSTIKLQLSHLCDRIREVNNGSYYVYYINKAFVFDSNFEESEDKLVSSVKVAVELTSKAINNESQDALDDDYIKNKSKTIYHSLHEQIRLPRTDILDYLKSNVHCIKLFEYDAKYFEDLELELIFEK